MALPKLLQKLFDDEGKGPKLKPSIIPTKINGQEPDETGEFNLQLSDPDAATRPEILTAVKKVTEASEVTFEPDESLPSVGHNIGEEWVSYTGVIPFGGIPYCGQEVTRETYRDLWEYAQTQGLVKSESEWQQIATANNGNVPYYSSGNGSTTFRMPRIAGYVKGASSQSESGSYVSEGLPQVILTNETQVTLQGGEVMSPKTAILESAGNGLGGLMTSSCNGNTGGTALDARKSTIVQNASRLVAQNAIYGNSSHVTPETSVVLFGVYAFGEITNQGALDATTLATGLARVESNLETKVDKTSAHIVETWKNGTQWYRKWSDGFIEQGGLSAKFSYQGWQTITLNISFSNTNYTITTASSVENTDSSVSDGANRIKQITTTSFNVSSWGNLYVYWYACGY